MEHNAAIALFRSATIGELLAYERAQRLLADASRRDAGYHQRQADAARAEINRRKRGG